MVMMAPVVAAAIEARRERRGGPRAWTVLMAPEGARLDHARAAALARAAERLLLVCGRYEGIDERVRELGLFDEEISLGDFVLPGGEAAALALTEAVSRLVPGVVGRGRVARERVVPAGAAGLPALHAPPRVPGPRASRRSSSRATTAGSSAGGGRGRSSGRAGGGRTCSAGARRSPGRAEGTEAGCPEERSRFD